MNIHDLFQQIEKSHSMTFEKMLGEGLSGIICKAENNGQPLSVKFFGLTRVDDTSVIPQENLIEADIHHQNEYLEKPYSNLSDFTLENAILEHLKECPISPDKQDSGVVVVENRIIPFLIYSYVDGVSIKQMILDNTDQSVSLKEKLLIISSLLENVAEMHQLGVVNRDIKSAHVLIRPDKTIKLLDYGASSLNTLKEKSKRKADLIYHEYSQGAWKVFTPWYLDPYRTKRPRASQDIYSLGIVAGELLTEKLLSADMSVGNIQIVAKYKTMISLAEYIREPLLLAFSDFGRKGPIEKKAINIVMSHFRHPWLRPSAKSLAKKYRALAQSI